MSGTLEIEATLLVTVGALALTERMLRSNIALPAP